MSAPAGIPASRRIHMRLTHDRGRFAQLPQGVRIVLIIAAGLAVTIGLMRLDSVIGPRLTWLWWQHTNATVLRCQEVDVPYGKGEEILDYCVVAWTQPTTVIADPGVVAHQNITDESTLDWVAGTHPAGTTVAIATHGNMAVTVQTTTNQGEMATFPLLLFVVAGIVLLIWYGRRRRRTRFATEAQPLLPPLA